MDSLLLSTQWPTLREFRIQILRSLFRCDPVHDCDDVENFCTRRASGRRRRQKQCHQLALALLRASRRLSQCVTNGQASARIVARSDILKVPCYVDADLRQSANSTDSMVIVELSVSMRAPNLLA